MLCRVASECCSLYCVRESVPHSEREWELKYAELHGNVESLVTNKNNTTNYLTVGYP